MTWRCNANITYLYGSYNMFAIMPIIAIQFVSSSIFFCLSSARWYLFALSLASVFGRLFDSR